MHLTRISVTADGGSASSRHPIGFAAHPRGLWNAGGPIAGFIFHQVPPSKDMGWHGPPQRLLGIRLGGSAILETTDGVVGDPAPGCLVLLEDLEGKGHLTRVQQTLFAAYIRLAPDFDAEALLAGETLAVVDGSVARRTEPAVTVVSADDRGGSRFGTQTIAWAPTPRGSSSILVPGTRLFFHHLPAGRELGWHGPSQRQFVFVLQGEAVIDCTSGEQRRFTVGDVLFLEDVDGRGHNTTTATGLTALYVPVDPDFRITNLGGGR